MKLKVCAAQMEIESLNAGKNLRKSSALIKEAKSKNCDIICFPELFLTGPLGEKAFEYAQEIPGEYTEEFSKLAKENAIYIIMGSITEKEDDNCYNTTVLIDDSGKIIGKYRKINLWNGEKIYKRAGSEVSVFDTKFGKIGLEICWDLAFPEIAKEITLRGAKIIFCPAFWSYEDKYTLLKSEELKKEVPDVDTESNFIDSCVPARAIEDEVVFVYVNGCGKVKVGEFTCNLVGHSQIAIPFYGRVALLENEEKLLIREIDLDLLDLAESVYEIRKDSVKQIKRGKV